MLTPFCDFCDCADCREGGPWLTHAKTADGRQICDVCYAYERCLDAGAPEPCKDACTHRPELETEFTQC